MSPHNRPRKHWVLPFFLLLCGAAAPAAPPIPAESPEAICRDLQARKAEIRKVSTLSAVWDLIRVKLRPGSVAQPRPTRIPTPDDKFLPRPDGLEPDGRNLVFSLELPEAIQGDPATARAEARLRQVNRELDAMKRPLRSFLKARDVAQCVDRVRASGFDFARFARLAVERGSLQWVAQARDGHAATRVLSRALPKLRLRWELFRATRLREVFQALRSPSVRNVVIVTHALDDGKILDSEFNEYPSRFFSDLSPNLESISIFSCHGAKVLEYYRLADAFRRFPSHHRNRAIYTARSLELFGVKDVVPLQSAGHFLRKVDRELASRRPASPVAAPFHLSYCQLVVSGLEVARGGYAFLLNGDFIGAATPLDARGPLRVSFPCGFAARPKNVLILKHLNLSQDSDLVDASRLSVELRRPYEAAALPAGTHYRRPNGTHQGSKWIWESRLEH